MNSQNNVVYSFAWYQRDDWQLLKESVEDPDTLDDSYEEWRKNANKTISDFKSSGQQVVKISVNVAELLDWCRNKGVAPNGKARSEYAAYLAQKRS